MRKLLILTFFCSFLFTSEDEVNKAWCISMNGNYQFITSDGTYVDCLTNEYAVEAEYDYNWKEGVGQALHYAESTNKKAAILFIKRKESKKDYLEELNRVLIKFNLPIKVFVTLE